MNIITYLRNVNGRAVGVVLQAIAQGGDGRLLKVLLRTRSRVCKVLPAYTEPRAGPGCQTYS